MLILGHKIKLRNTLTCAAEDKMRVNKFYKLTYTQGKKRLEFHKLKFISLILKMLHDGDLL